MKGEPLKVPDLDGQNLKKSLTQVELCISGSVGYRNSGCFGDDITC